MCSTAPSSIKQPQWRVGGTPFPQARRRLSLLARRDQLHHSLLSEYPLHFISQSLRGLPSCDHLCLLLCGQSCCCCAAHVSPCPLSVIAPFPQIPALPFSPRLVSLVLWTLPHTDASMEFFKIYKCIMQSHKQ